MLPIYVNWCYMCKNDKENVSVEKGIVVLDPILVLSGVDVPRRVQELLFSWRGAHIGRRRKKAWC